MRREFIASGFFGGSPQKKNIIQIFILNAAPNSLRLVNCKTKKFRHESIFYFSSFAQRLIEFVSNDVLKMLKLEC